MNWERILTNFTVGGFMIAVVSYLASFENPVIAAIIWSYPLSIVPSLYNMKANHRSNQYMAKFLFSTTFALGLLVLCTLSISYDLHHSKQSDGITPAILKSTALWMVCAAVFYGVVDYGGYSKYFY